MVKILDSMHIRYFLFLQRAFVHHYKCKFSTRTNPKREIEPQQFLQFAIPAALHSSGQGLCGLILEEVLEREPRAGLHMGRGTSAKGNQLFPHGGYGHQC